jgi:hypothetical protein
MYVEIDKGGHAWGVAGLTTIDREKRLRSDRLFEVLSAGISHLVNTAFYNPDFVEKR